MRETYQGTPSKSKEKFQLAGNRQLAAQIPLPRVPLPFRYSSLSASVVSFRHNAVNPKTQPRPPALRCSVIPSYGKMLREE